MHYLEPKNLKVNKWKYDKLPDYYASLPRTSLNNDAYTFQGQNRLINTLSFENDLLKGELSKVYHNEKNQFEKINELK